MSPEQVRASGWAARGTGQGRDWRKAYLPPPYPTGEDDAEPAHTIAEAFAPPHPLALPVEVCRRIVAAAQQVPGSRSGNGTYYLPDLDDAPLIVEHFAAVNAAWWDLDLTRWTLGVKRYEVGQRHGEHQDLHPTAARRKLAGVVQLSDPDDYAGGDLVMRLADYREAVPRQTGTLVAFPGWTLHEVEPITAGTRWSLCVNGWGPPLR